ncbi:MAG TPA: DNA primase [Spirochaetota bacterium]|nr:DNA primase [Spirochaetota bacterium]
MNLSKDTIEYVRERAKIEDIAQKYVPSLKKQGRNYVGLCPFHKEKTPSFSVSPEKQMFHCFGCNVGGNVFTFLSKIENISFPESVKRAADICGVHIEYDTGKTAGSVETIRRLNLYAMNYYSNYYYSSEGRAGREYLLKRGVNEESAKKFRLGMSPDSWDKLASALVKNRADMEVAEKAGLVGKSSKTGNYIDKFRNRVMFPIFDRSGNVVAFGGRSMSNEQQPKYLNSPESEVFQKRNILYGLNFAMDEIRQMDRAIIVEGYLDVIGCHQFGIKNVVAPLGTALTENHIRQLSQLCNEIIMLFDSDSAGVNASLRSIETSESFNVEIRIATLPDKDPFDFVMNHDVRELMIHIDKALKPVDFRILNTIEANRGKNKIAVLKILFGIIENIELLSERDIYLKKISELLQLDENSVRGDFSSHLKNRNVKERTESPETVHPDYETKIFRDLIALVLKHPEIAGDVIIDFSGESIGDQVAAKIFGVICKLYQDENELKIDKIFDFFPDGLEMDFLNSAIQNETSIEDPKAAYTEIYVNLKLHKINKKITDYAEKIRNSGSDRLEYLAELEILRREKEKLTSYMYNKGSVRKD